MQYKISHLKVSKIQHESYFSRTREPRAKWDFSGDKFKMQTWAELISGRYVAVIGLHGLLYEQLAAICPPSVSIIDPDSGRPDQTV